MQGRETLEGERRARKFGVGKWTWWGILFWRDNVWVIFLCPWAFLLVLPMPCPTKPTSFLSEASFEYFSSLLIFAWISFSRVNSQVRTHTVLLLISKAAPWSVAGALVVSQRAKQQAVEFTCSGRFKEDEAWTAAKVPELSASLLAPSFLSQRACRYFFFSP